MAEVTGNEYEYLKIQSGEDTTKHYLKDKVTRDRTDHSLYQTIDQSQNYMSNYHIDTRGAVGTDLSDKIANPHSLKLFGYVILPCKAGDKFVLTSTASNIMCVWAFTDANYILESSSTTSVTTVTNATLVAKEDGYFIVNHNLSKEYSLVATQLVQAASNDVVAPIDQIMHQTIDYSADFIVGNRISLNKSTGAEVDVANPIPTEGWNYIVLPCGAGDHFTMTGSAASNSEYLWAFLDADHKLLSRAANGAVLNNNTLIANADGYLVCNVENTEPYSLSITKLIKPISEEAVDGMQASITALNAKDTELQNDIDALDTDVSGLKSAFAPEYDATKTYNAGDYVTYENLLYRCFCDITTPENWADNHWMNVDAGSEMRALQRKEITYLHPGTDGTIPGAYVPGVTAVATGNRLVINGEAPASSTSIVIKAFNGWLKASSNQGTVTTKRFQLIDGHTYQAELKYISGTATSNVYVRFANGNGNGAAGTYTTNINGDNVARCVYSKALYPDGISPNVYITRDSTGNTLTDYTVELTIRDITDEAQIAPIENTIAMDNHDVGDAFWLDGILYKATSAIAVGEAIVPGTNAAETAVMEELSALNTSLSAKDDKLTDTVDAIIETETIAIEKTINAYFNGAELVGASYGKVAYANVQGYKRVTVTKAAGSTFVIGFTTNVPTNHNSIIGLVYNNTGTELSADVPENGNYIVILFYNSNKDTATPEELLASINITGLVGAVDSKARTQIDDIEEAFNNANDFALTNYANGACGELIYNNNPFATNNYVFSGTANIKAFCISGNPSLPPSSTNFADLPDEYFTLPLEAGKTYTLVMYATTEQTASGRITFYFADKTTKKQMTTAPELDPVANNGKIATVNFTVPTTDMYALKVYPRTSDNRTVKVAIYPQDCLYQQIATTKTEVTNINNDISDLKNRMLVTPEVYITKNAYIQNGTRTIYNRTLKITDGFIEFQVTGAYNRGLIINKKPADAAGDFKGVGVTLSEYTPILDDLSEINILRGCNALRFYAEQTTTASNPVAFMQLLFYNVSDDVITKVGAVSFTPEINGYNIKYFTIPDETTHYVLMAYQVANNNTNTKAAIQFTREDTSATALALSE